MDYEEDESTLTNEMPEDGYKDGIGDMDEDDAESINRKYAEEHGYVVDGFECPHEFLTMLAPMEFEELVNMFRLYDANGSGTIDKHEARKILLDLGLDASMSKAEDLLALVDADGSGEIEFDEFCKFIVMIKQGDERLSSFKNLLGHLHSTPLGALEKQAQMRELTLKFITLEEREPTATTQALTVVELHISGTWHTVENGKLVSKFEIKRYQGMGKSIREAKFSAASNAILKLGDMMPGVKYKEGEIPDDWMEWINENLARGVEPAVIVRILSTKGFHPYRNLAFMQQVLVWRSLDGFLALHPDFHYDEDTCDNVSFRQWVIDSANKGIDGEIILKVLEDRFIDIRRYDPFFAQKLFNNELGVVLGIDGQLPVLLDFFVACEKGYYDDVFIYCSCQTPINEEGIGRHNSESQRPLSLAAANGHEKVVSLLIEHHADVNAVDKKGRSALHLAAWKGHVNACKVLLEHGARLFEGDFEGNTPLHLAAIGNSIETVDFLAASALDFTRSITSDRVRPRPDKIFNDFVADLFEVMQREKLHPSESRRFEKLWIADAASRFIQLMDPAVSHMVSRGSRPIMDDVLNRFDPRPETGIYIQDGVGGSQRFVPSVASPVELAALLRAFFRQSALDTLNNLKRSPLHVACDANRIDSHARVIFSLIDNYGSNIFLRDRHNRRPLDLLMLDRVYGNIPSSTQINEEIIEERRTKELDKLSEEYDELERERTAERRHNILAECKDLSMNCSFAVWEILREGSNECFRYGPWRVHEDPDTMNLFYFKIPLDFLKGDKYCNYSWFNPPSLSEGALSVAAFIHRKIGILFLTQIRSTLLRKIAQWACYQCNVTGMNFYYDPIQEKLQYSTPFEAQWKQLIKFATIKDKLGYANEWDAMEDQYGNTFYRNSVTRECFWERPVDAVKASPIERFCTAFQWKGKAIEQVWYTCEQCNREWKSSAEGAKVILKLCEPCVFRCHSNHKGIRAMKTALSLCNCIQIGKVVKCACVARSISVQQTKIQGIAFDLRVEAKRKREQDLFCSPILAMVPPVWPDGKRKSLSGWMLCRRPPPKNVALFDPKRLKNKKNMKKRGMEDKNDANIDLSNMNLDSDLESNNDLDTATDSDSDSDLETRGELSVEMGLTGSLIEKQPSVVSQLDYLSLHGSENFRDPIAGLSESWIEVMDPEEVDEIPVKARVLVSVADSPIKVYGTCLGLRRPGFYDISLEAPENCVKIVSRPHIEVISKAVFYFNTESGESAWRIDDIQKQQVFSSSSLALSLRDWEMIYERSKLRRVFSTRDELICPGLDTVFYLNYPQFLLERSCLKIQRFFRQRKRLPFPHLDLPCLCFSFDTPNEIVTEMETQLGWAYLRRRSNQLGDFKDAEGIEWEEYSDRITSEYFYWTEEENYYIWDKPVFFNHLLHQSRNQKELLKVGEEVMYLFPGRRIEEIGVILKVRFDDSTGEDMYDVGHKYLESVKQKWVQRMELKKPPMEGEALMLRKLESRWVHQIRRKNEADERRRKRDREKRLFLEMERLKTLRSLALKSAAGEEISSDEKDSMGDTTKLMKGRLLRINQEYQDVTLDKERQEALQRHQKVKEEIDRIRSTSTVTLSRADVLSLTRSLELRIKLQERVVKRNALQLELNIKKQETLNRIRDSEEFLREKESDMSSPKSLKRRKLCRRVHFAMQRQKDKYMICEWGCGDWVRLGYELLDHQQTRCTKRILACTLGCPMKKAEEEWLKPYQRPPKQRIVQKNSGNNNSTSTTGNNNNTNLENDEEEDAESVAELRRLHGESVVQVEGITVQQYHETEECPKRLISCPRQCLEWVPFDVLEHHLQELCTRRPAKPIYCRLGCGACFGGTVEKLLEAEDDRLMHETDQCDFRIVRCNWKFDDGRFCAAQLMAKDRDEHRDYHLALMGITTYLVPGTYLYRLPRGVSRIKIQAWGGGGGSGYFLNRRGGAGGGAAFVECILNLEPYDVLEIVVGSGGQGGVLGTEIMPMDLSQQRQNMADRRNKEMFMTKEERLAQYRPPEAQVIDGSCGTALGGTPGGGPGYGGGGAWAAGGGGGYSIISRRTPKGSQALVVASGGGGGGSLDGLPGSGMEGPLPGSRMDPINGMSASCEKAGRGGDSGSSFNAQWPASDGEQWLGGQGSEYGGGGGGGYFGGGGGGTMPGIGGGGGGGSCYVYVPRAHDYVIVSGSGHLPGGLKHDPLAAVGVGEWDKVGGWAGQGASPDVAISKPGNNGAVRIFKPGHY